MKNKVSLIKDIFSKETFDPNTNFDERIISEKNKISDVGMSALISLLVIFGIFSDVFNIGRVSQYLSMIIGVVNYGMLIAYCKKGIVKHSSVVMVFIWSMFTLPLAIVNQFLDMFVQGKMYAIFQLIIIVAVPVLLYAVINIIYKRSMKEE